MLQPGIPFHPPILLASALTAMLAAGCATDPDKLVWDNVAPEVYAGYDCDQLALEIVYTGYRVRDLYTWQAAQRQHDVHLAEWSWFYGITALFLNGDGPEAQEYQNLRGRFEAARLEALNKTCGFEANSPEVIIENAKAHLTSEGRASE